MDRPLKILYALQGTGNGHMARAREIVPLLQTLGNHEIHVWVSGTQSELSLPFPIQRKLHGFTLYYGKKGSVHLGRTLLKNRLFTFLWDVWQSPVTSYDFILNDFEPVSAWAGRIRGIPVFALSHQAAVVHPDAPRPKSKKPWLEKGMYWFAPYQAANGFHFKALEPYVFPPVIRKEIRNLPQTPSGSLLVYLPAYTPEKLLPILTSLDVPVNAYFRGAFSAYTVEHVTVLPIDSTQFLQSFQCADSVLCGAGFELPTEALFHGKRVAVVPIKNQYEQACNAAAAVECGAWHFSKLKKKNVKALRKWLKSPAPKALHCPDQTEEILIDILRHFAAQGDFKRWKNEQLVLDLTLP